MWIIWHRSNTRGRDDDEHVRCFIITPDMFFTARGSTGGRPRTTLPTEKNYGTNPRGNFMETDHVHPSTIHLP